MPSFLCKFYGIKQRHGWMFRINIWRVFAKSFPISIEWIQTKRFRIFNIISKFICNKNFISQQGIVLNISSYNVTWNEFLYPCSRSQLFLSIFKQKFSLCGLFFSLEKYSSSDFAVTRKYLLGSSLKPASTTLHNTPPHLEFPIQQKSLNCFH